MPGDAEYCIEMYLPLVLSLAPRGGAGCCPRPPLPWRWRRPGTTAGPWVAGGSGGMPGGPEECIELALPLVLSLAPCGGTGCRFQISSYQIKPNDPGTPDFSPTGKRYRRFVSPCYVQRRLPLLAVYRSQGPSSFVLEGQSRSRSTWLFRRALLVPYVVCRRYQPGSTEAADMRLAVECFQ